MILQLRIMAGRDAGKAFKLVDGQPLLVGRDMGTATRLKDPQVAMLHCEVLLKDGKVTLTDRGSSGGTLVNNQRIQQVELQPGDVFRVGDTRISLEKKEAGLEGGYG